MISPLKRFQLQIALYLNQIILFNVIKWTNPRIHERFLSSLNYFSPEQPLHTGPQTLPCSRHLHVHGPGVEVGDVDVVVVVVIIVVVVVPLMILLNLPLLIIVEPVIVVAVDVLCDVHGSVDQGENQAHKPD